MRWFLELVGERDDQRLARGEIRMDSLKGILAVLWNVDGPVMLDGSLCQEGDMEVSEVGITWTGWRG